MDAAGRPFPLPEQGSASRRGAGRARRRDDRGDRLRGRAHGRATTSAPWAPPRRWRSRTSGSTPSCAQRSRSCGRHASACWYRPRGAAPTRAQSARRRPATARVAGAEPQDGALQAARGSRRRRHAARPSRRRARLGARGAARAGPRLHPAMLSERGLRTAVESSALRAPVPVELGPLPAERLPEAIELAAYFVISEASRTSRSTLTPLRRL